MIKNRGHRASFLVTCSYIEGVFTRFTTAIVACYVKKKNHNVFPMNGHSLDTIILASTDKEKKL